VLYGLVVIPPAYLYFHAIENYAVEETLMIGKTISQYKFLEKFGEGGLCVVCKVEATKDSCLDGVS